MNLNDKNEDSKELVKTARSEDPPGPDVPVVNVTKNDDPPLMLLEE